MSIYLLLLTMFTTCGNINESAKNLETESVKPVTETVEEPATEDEILEDDLNMLIGKITKKELQQEPYASWFNSGYNNYNPSEEAMEKIKKNISEYEITVFMGTWCSDSKREVPKLYKILDVAGYDLSKLTIIGVDRNKSTPEKYEQEWNIERVPTIIFTKDGKEVNRFVEYSKESIEEDIANIVTGNEYVNAYAD